MNPETLKDWTRSVVDDFLARKVPLNEGIAKLASEQHLTDKQVARVVEAANQTAYLKIHASSKNKNFEFPLASVQDIRTKLLTPAHEKTASHTEPRNPVTAALRLGVTMEKTASKVALPKPTVAEFALTFQKEAEEIGQLTIERDIRFLEFHKMAEALRADAEWPVKIASAEDVSGVRSQVVKYLKGSTESASPFMKQAELVQSQKVLKKFAEVAALTQEIGRRSKKLEKVAFLGEVAEELGSVIPKIVHGATSLGAKGLIGATKYTAKNPGTVARWGYSGLSNMNKVKDPGVEQWTYSNE